MADKTDQSKTQDQRPWFARLLGTSRDDDAQAEDDVFLPGAADPAADAQHPVLVAALAAGVSTAAQFKEQSAQAADGRAYAAEVDAFLSQQAVRLFGPTDGPARAKNSAHLPVADRRAVANDWCDQGDAKYGIGKNGEPPRRSSAPAALPVGRNAESTADKDTRKEEAPAGGSSAGAPTSLNPDSIYEYRRRQAGANKSV